ncbi:MFS transporter [Infirmifilum sp. NZ]|uniref:MFS transporter n=1 Tax=Infirmifilum sp. NZ TaxID=2926850 RepID=UPI0027A8B641|nr:MFS transporter [Infirmifilum sp. NZ]UNQ72893.1 MFS transporter [Infirmifilum sp. NZ]
MLRDIAKWWSRLPVAAKRYIVFQALTVPVLFAWILVPYLMLATGLSVAEAGIVLTAASAIATVVNAIVGRVLDRAEPVVFIAVISLVEGVAYFIYMYGFLANILLLIVVAAVVERLARGFYPVFKVYEYDVYPQEFREKAFALHNLIPYLAQLATYPLIGYVLAVLSDSLYAQITSLGMFALASTALGFLALAWLPRIGVRRIKVSQLLLRRIPEAFIKMSLAIMVFGVAFELCQPLVVANLFVEIAGNPLLGLAYYEAFAALPAVIVLPLILRDNRRYGVLLLVSGMGLIALADLLLGFSYKVEIALLAAMAASAGYALVDPFFTDVLFSTIPKEYRGSLLGSLAAVRGLIGIAMPAIAGFIAEINAHLPFILAAIIVTFAAGLTLSVAKPYYRSFNIADIELAKP